MKKKRTKAGSEAAQSAKQPSEREVLPGWAEATPTERAALVRTLWSLRWCGDAPDNTEGRDDEEGSGQLFLRGRSDAPDTTEGRGEEPGRARSLRPDAVREWGEDPERARAILALPLAHRHALREPERGLLRIHEQTPGRRAAGRYYTPAPLARALAEALVAAGAHPGKAPILDPACGAGALLLGVAEVALARGIPADAIVDNLHGWDLDPVAVALAQVRLVDRLGPTPDRLRRVRARLCCLDALRDAPTGLQAGVTLLNPPYRTAIRHETGRSAAENEAYALRFPLAARGAYDLGALFLELALHATRADGHIALLVPQALITHHGSQPIREALHTRFPLHTILHDESGSWFDGADVRVCGVILGGRPERRFRVCRWDGSQARHLPHPGAHWGVALSPLAALPEPPPTWPTLQSLVTLKAGAAASEAYDLLPRIVDDPAPQAGLKLITTGAIDPHQLLWGERETRYLRHRFRHPRLPLDALSPTRRAQQQAPKVLVAGLSRVLEAVHDAEGECAAAVAVLTLRVRREVTPSALPLSRLALWLNSAWARAWYRRRWGGTQLGGASVQVHKGKLGALPLPPGLVGEADAAGGTLPGGETFAVPRDEAAWPEALAALEERGLGLAAWPDAALRAALDALCATLEAEDAARQETAEDTALEAEGTTATEATAATLQARAEPLLAALVLRGGVRLRPDVRSDPAPHRAP